MFSTGSRSRSSASFSASNLLVQVGDLLLDFRAPLAACGVGLFFQRFLFHLQLANAAVQRVDFAGCAVQFHAAAAGGFVNEIDGFVRQETIGDVAVGKHGCRHQRAVLDAHAMMHLVTLLQAAQDADSVFDGRLIDHHRLEAAFQSGVLLDMLAVLVKGGCADAVQFAARQHGLEHIGGIHRAFRRARAYKGMQFVDEEDNAALGAWSLLSTRP